MKYCINYNSDFHYLDQVDEINIKIEDIDYDSFIAFINAHQNQRIHLTIEEDNDFLDGNILRTFSLLKEKYPNFVFRIPRKENIITKLKEYNIPFWIKTYVSDWDTLIYFLSLGVTDITIIEEMGFELDKVAAVVHKSGAKVRILPNVAQSSIMETSGIKKFFVRPEDIALYEPYVDVCEFFGSLKSIETYYKIYAIDKQWFGDLNEIIISLNTSIDNRSIEPEFGGRRLRCEKKCLKGAFCKHCEIAKQFAQTLSDRNLIFKQNKN